MVLSRVGLRWVWCYGVAGFLVLDWLVIVVFRFWTGVCGVASAVGLWFIIVFGFWGVYLVVCVVASFVVLYLVIMACFRCGVLLIVLYIWFFICRQCVVMI